jgi:hypothetical protein
MKYLLVCVCSIAFSSFAQTKKENLIRLSSAYTMFPDSLRKVTPRVYNNKIYNWQQHYYDSTVLTYIPSHFNKQKPFKIVIWIHGWYNSIDSVFNHFPLKEAIDSSQQNCILLLPEGPKNAPDSYSGKWEKPNYFNWFLNDIQQQLISQKILSQPSNSFIYAGHSGAYKAIANMLQHGKVNCQAVILFDALYGEIDTFLKYIKSNPNSWFLNVYCKGGGTYKNSIDFMANLDTNNIKHCNRLEKDITPTLGSLCKIAHIYSNLEHNEVITKTNYLKILLQNVK